MRASSRLRALSTRHHDADASSTTPKPMLVILFGPPGSGKSTLFEEYKKKYKLSMDIQQFAVDDFVYGHRNYKEKHKSMLERTPESLQALFSEFLGKGHYQFRKAIQRMMTDKESLAIDVAGRGIKWVEGVQRLAEVHGYAVTVLYPMVDSVDELVSRIENRFNLTGQTPIPKEDVMEIAGGAHARFWELLKLFRDQIETVALFDATHSLPLFVLDVQANKCQFLNHSMQPCPFQIKI